MKTYAEPVNPDDNGVLYAQYDDSGRLVLSVGTSDQYAAKTILVLEPQAQRALNAYIAGVTL